MAVDNIARHDTGSSAEPKVDKPAAKAKKDDKPAATAKKGALAVGDHLPEFNVETDASTEDNKVMQSSKV